ncbi:MAG: helix-turn-helix domain-containing protein [Clostridium sp.]|nr:helix-turn-helix domain-containing protein [Clostridium sp.]
MASVHDRIKERRSEIGMTLLQLADQVGVKEATAQRWESGAIKNIPYNRIVEIANVLRCTPQYLMGWDIEEQPVPSEEDGLDSELIRRLAQLTPDEVAKVDAFVQGILAMRGE